MNPRFAEVWDGVLSGVGLDPTDTHEGTEDPIGIGNAAAAAVIAARSNDGARATPCPPRIVANAEPFGAELCMQRAKRMVFVANILFRASLWHPGDCNPTAVLNLLNIVTIPTTNFCSW